MCRACGCGAGEIRIEGMAPGRDDHARRVHDHSDHHSHHHHDHGPAHDHHEHGANGAIHYGKGAARTSIAGFDQAQVLRIEQDILAKNAGYAGHNRRRLTEASALALNLISSPGAGKTTLLVSTIKALSGRVPVAVIEGDQETSNDADRIRATGAPAIQINTGRGCHLDAHMVGHAMEELPIGQGTVLFVENVGNLVCPAGFDLGEAHKVVILSVTEGDDKPLKYPDAFAAADLMLLTKTDLLPHVDFDVAACLEMARRVNPEIEMIEVSARTGEGLGRWLAWIEAARAGGTHPGSP